jgi:hypothetical protein
MIGKECPFFLVSGLTSYVHNSQIEVINLKIHVVNMGFFLF